MKYLNIFIGLLAIILLIPANASDKERGIYVSLINLIATPEKYDEKVVFIKVYLTIEFENMSLCPSKEVVSRKDCLWLEIGEDLDNTEEDHKVFMERLNMWNKFNKKVVSIRGTFDKENTGHFGGWSGGIKFVTEVFGEGGVTKFTPNKSFKPTQ